MNARRSSSDSGRRGAVMVVAMICLLLVVMILGSLLKLARTYREQMRWEDSRLQAQWLAESSLERAASRLQADPDYTGEVWEVSAAELDGRNPGRVQITVAAPSEPAQAHVLRVEAIFPSDGLRFVKRSKQIAYEADSSDRE